jgi:hypothetical protein
MKSAGRVANIAAPRTMPNCQKPAVLPSIDVRQDRGARQRDENFQRLILTARVGAQNEPEDRVHRDHLEEGGRSANGSSRAVIDR